MKKIWLTGKEVIQHLEINIPTLEELITTGRLTPHDNKKNPIAFGQDETFRRRKPVYRSRGLSEYRDMPEQVYREERIKVELAIYKMVEVELLEEKGIERKGKPEDRRPLSEEPLNGKGAIAKFLHVTIGTVNSYIKEGMPVYRPMGPKGPVIAYPSEVNEWLRTYKKD
jgi:hypothetical protein